MPSTSLCRRRSTDAADLAGRLSLGTLTGILALADLTVGNDSGPLNLARAVGSRTVGIYWFGNLINAGPASRTRHRPAISWRRECPVCRADCLYGRCSHDPTFVDDVRPEEVLGSGVELLAASRARGDGRGEPGCREQWRL